MIELKNITKSFQTGANAEVHQYLFKSFWQHLKRSQQKKLVIDNMNLTIANGERVAFVGPNKSGKTTLAHIIAGISKPNSGTVKVQGKVVAVFGLGVGYSTLLTGRENLILNATALGASFSWLRKNMSSIISFAEIEDLDIPLKFYSNGMRARLALAAALFIPCDILILDEVFSGLDETFKAKSLSLLETQLNTNNTTLIMIDHDENNLKRLCNREIVFNK